MDDNTKKEYHKPELVEWGSVTDLTLSPRNGPYDATSGGSDENT